MAPVLRIICNVFEGTPSTNRRRLLRFVCPLIFPLPSRWAWCGARVSEAVPPLDEHIVVNLTCVKRRTFYAASPLFMGALFDMY